MDRSKRAQIRLILGAHFGANARSADLAFAPNVTNNTAYLPFSFLFAKRMSPMAPMFCSVVHSCDTHLKLRDHVVNGASFLTGGVFECGLAHRRSVAVICMLYKIKCNPMHPH